MAGANGLIWPYLTMQDNKASAGFHLHGPSFVDGEVNEMMVAVPRTHSEGVNSTSIIYRRLPSLCLSELADRVFPTGVVYH